MLLTSSCPEILVRIAHDSALIGLVKVVRKPRRLLFPTQPCAHRVLGSGQLLYKTEVKQKGGKMQDVWLNLIILLMTHCLNII